VVLSCPSSTISRESVSLVSVLPAHEEREFRPGFSPVK